MPGYVKKAIERFLHILRKYGRHKHDAPHKHNIPQYGAKVQMTEPPDTTPELSNLDKLLIMQIVGVFSTTLVQWTPPCSSLLATLHLNKAPATEATMEAVIQFLNYAATHPDAVLKVLSGQQ
jgi:hypothetical protein